MDFCLKTGSKDMQLKAGSAFAGTSHNANLIMLLIIALLFGAIFVVLGSIITLLTGANKKDDPNSTFAEERLFAQMDAAKYNYRLAA